MATVPEDQLPALELAALKALLRLTEKDQGPSWTQHQNKPDPNFEEVLALC